METQFSEASSDEIQLTQSIMEDEGPYNQLGLEDNTNRDGSIELLEYLKLQRAGSSSMNSSNKRKNAEDDEPQETFNFVSLIEQYTPKKKKIEPGKEFMILESLVVDRKALTTKLAPQVSRFASNITRTNAWLIMDNNQWKDWNDHVAGLLENLTITELQMILYFKILHSAISTVPILPWSLLGTECIPKIEFTKKKGDLVNPQYYNNSTFYFYAMDVCIKRNPFSKHQTNMITFRDIDVIRQVQLDLEGQTGTAHYYNGLWVDDTLHISLFSFQDGSVPLYTCLGVDSVLKKTSINPQQMVDRAFSVAVVMPFRTTYTNERCYLDLKLLSLYQLGA